VPGEEAPQRPVAEAKVLAGEFATQLLDRHVAAGLERAQDQAGMRFDCRAAPVAAEWPGPQVAGLSLQCAPSADARGTHIEARRCRTMAQPFIPHGRDNALPQIQRKCLRHSCRPPLRQKASISIPPIRESLAIPSARMAL
jgi:hypothetical protein